MAFRREIFVAAFRGPEPGIGFVKVNEWEAKKYIQNACVRKKKYLLTNYYYRETYD